MTVGDFIAIFLQTVGLPDTLEDIINATINRAIELVANDGDPSNDDFIDDIKRARTPEEIKYLMESNADYYNIFMSTLIIILEEKTRHMTFTPEQSEVVNNLLDKLEMFNQEV